MAPLQAVNLIRSIDLFSTRPVVVVAWAPMASLGYRWLPGDWSIGGEGPGGALKIPGTFTVYYIWLWINTY